MRAGWARLTEPLAFHAEAASSTPSAQLRRTIMGHSMNKLFVIVTLTTTFAVPAFAQQTPNSRQDAQTSRRSLRVHVYAPNYYQPWYGNQNLNPDFQLGYTR
jgi:hypothetical protein